MQDELLSAIKEENHKKIVQLLQPIEAHLPPELLFMIALSYIQLKKNDMAEQYFKKLHSHRHSLKNYFSFLATVYIRQKKYKKAANVLKKETTLNLLFYEQSIQLALNLRQLIRANRLLKEAFSNGFTSDNLNISQMEFDFMKKNFTAAQSLFLELLPNHADDERIQAIIAYLCTVGTLTNDQKLAIFSQTSQVKAPKKELLIHAGQWAISNGQYNLYNQVLKKAKKHLKNTCFCV